MTDTSQTVRRPAVEPFSETAKAMIFAGVVLALAVAAALTIKLLALPLLMSTIVAAGFVFGDLRIATGSVWPSAIAHATHNVAWGALLAFTVTASPVLVDEYLVGDCGLLILVATVIAAVWLRAHLASPRAGDVPVANRP